MRAVSLSNPTVIALLNGQYVPVYASNADYAPNGVAPPAEKAELRRIFQEGYAKKLSVGSVHAYILGPEGHLRDSMHTANVAKPDLLIAMLRRNADALQVRPGPPLVKPEPPAHPAAPPGGLLLHLVARYLERHGDDYTLVRNAGGNWSALPSDDWIPLTHEQCRALVPAGTPAPGETWTPDTATARALLSHFYPPTENWDPAANRIEEMALTGAVESVTGGVARARLSGRLKMTHDFYHKADGRYVEAEFEGYVDFGAGGSIGALRLVTTRGDYLGGGQDLPYGIALRETR